MSDYNKATNFATKDTLLTGNPAKAVKGTEIDNEFNAIASSIATKVEIGDVNDAIAAALASTSGTGTIRQIVKATTTSSSVSTSFPTLQATGHSATITPTSSSSKILVLVSSSSYVFGSGSIGVYSVYRGSTNLCGNGTNKFNIESGVSSGASQFQGSIHMTFLDEPASTSALTYQVYQGCASGSSEYNISLFATMLLVEIL